GAGWRTTPGRRAGGRSTVPSAGGGPEPPPARNDRPDPPPPGRLSLAPPVLLFVLIVLVVVILVRRLPLAVGHLFEEPPDGSPARAREQTGHQHHRQPGPPPEWPRQAGHGQ